MENKQQNSTWYLTGYYGILQTLHLFTLAYAGLRILQGVPAPFPILPPPGGWTDQTMGFLYGLAGTDVIGILLGIIFAYRAVLKGDFRPWLGLLSLTIFITGALVFGAGTFPSGAWGAYPVSYWVMVLLFLPTVFLYFQLLKTKARS